MSSKKGKTKSVNKLNNQENLENLKLSEVSIVPEQSNIKTSFVWSYFGKLYSNIDGSIHICQNHFFCNACLKSVQRDVQDQREQENILFVR